MADPITVARLAPIAQTVIAGGTYDQLVVHGGPPSQARNLLAGVGPEQLLSVPVKSPDAAKAMLAGLWLWHDALDESHTISQSLHDPTGSFWHAIMHRREGDFWNSKYWYARCRNHPALADIAARAKPVLATLADKPLASRLCGGGWDADAFVDWVEQVCAGSDQSSRELAVKLQQLEWQALFDHCVWEAAGR